eukprot:TRINITY_DN54818_c0_g1_i2.p1 TRINITY_DN54818_c0_g1~~TRINITY_DN54818_c0_g1_i2.p1  ORF type:complete len:176 (+),score=34.88 TRINITY_DN54818_c0_g1_i2:28-528(+)
MQLKWCLLLLVVCLAFWVQAQEADGDGAAVDGEERELSKKELKKALKKAKSKIAGLAPACMKRGRDAAEAVDPIEEMPAGKAAVQQDDGTAADEEKQREVEKEITKKAKKCYAAGFKKALKSLPPAAQAELLMSQLEDCAANNVKEQVVRYRKEKREGKMTGTRSM